MRQLALVLSLLALSLLVACEDRTTPPSEADDVADAAVDQTAEASAPPPCTTFGVTGTAPRCKVFAYCSSGDYELDCNRDDGRCRCRTVTGKGRADVPYESAFCSLPDGGDPTETSEGLAAQFASAMRACEWTP